MLCDVNAELILIYTITGSVSTRSQHNLAVEVTGMLLRGSMAALGRIDGGQQATHFIDMRHASVTRWMDGRMHHVTLSFTSLSRNLQVGFCVFIFVMTIFNYTRKYAECAR